jgi:hypothetical protein
MDIGAPKQYATVTGVEPDKSPMFSCVSLDPGTMLDGQWE